MQIKKVIFNKKDYAYTIEYFDGKDVRIISTNEEALSSMDEAITNLVIALSHYFELSAEFDLIVNTVKFAPNEKSSSTIQLAASDGGKKHMAILCKVYPIFSGETEPDPEQVEVLKHLKSLEIEVDKYVRGERAQPELDFSENAPETEVIQDDSFLDFGDDN